MTILNNMNNLQIINTVQKHEDDIQKNRASLEDIPNQPYITEKAKQSDLNTTNAKVNLKSDKSYVDLELTKKANDNEVRKKNVLLDTNDITDTLRQQINGNAPIMQTVGDEIVTPMKTTFIKRGLNLYNKNTVIQGKYISFQDGTLLDNVNYFATDFIRVIPAQTYSRITINGAHFAFYDNSKKYITSTYANALPATFTTPANAYYLRLTVMSSTKDTGMIVSGVNTNTPYCDYSEKLDKNYLADLTTNDLKDYKQELNTIFLASNNLFDKNAVQPNKYIDINGVVYDNASYSLSDYIYLKSGETYTCSNARQIVFYKIDKTILTGASIDNLTNTITFTVPNLAVYMRMSVHNTWKDTLQVEKGSVKTEYHEYGITYLNKPIFNVLFPNIDSKSYWSYLNSSNLNSIMQLENNNIMKNQIILFNADIATFSGLRIGHGKTDYNGYFLEVDNTNIKVYGNTPNASLSKTLTHGLVIKDFITVQVETNSLNQAKVILTTSTGMYESDYFDFYGNNGYVFAENIGSNLSNCILKFSCKDYNKPIFAFGDSYFNNVATSRWTSYIMKNGYNNWLLDGFPGRNSLQAYNSLLLNLQHCTPEYILWCMGMNDPDTDTVINSNWKNTIDSLVYICNDKKIELILATIPNVCGNGTTEVPRNHSFKNAYIKTLGKRYIDFAKCVNGYATNTWYSGMLHTDGVHPTDLGAKALASRATIDCPELLNS